MNRHVYLLAFLIGSGEAPPALSSAAVLPLPGVAAFLVQPAVGSSRRQEATHTYLARHSFTAAAPYHDEHAASRCHRCPTSRRSSSLTRADAGRGGRGRRRGVSGSEGVASATAVAHRPNVTAAAEATLAVQHAATEDLLRVAHAHRGVLRPGVLSQALLRMAKHLVQDAKKTARKKALNDPRLLELFLVASAPVAALPNSSSPSSPPSSPSSTPSLSSGKPQTALEGRARGALSGPQAADIVWACGLLRWVPCGADGQARLAQLVEFVARAASSKSGIDDWNVTNVVWALDRLGVAANTAAVADAAAVAAAVVVAPGEGEGEGEGKGEGPGGADREGGAVEAIGQGGDGARFLVGTVAIEELRKRVQHLPFQAIPSLFEGLRVEDFREEVAFGRDEILLGGGKVLSESRLTAWQSSDGLPFAYSGKVMEPSPFSPNVLRLRDALYERTGILYDGVLLNLYESRTSAMRYHSDPDVGTVWTQDTSVVSVGDTRQFALRETLDHSRRHTFYLSSGDCVRMTAGCQRDYQHCVKVAKEDVGARVSLVFKQSIAVGKN